MNVWSQTAAPEDLSGEDLKDWLKENYYDDKHVQLGYDGSDGARAMMYNYIDNQDGVVTCVYSGYEVETAYGGTTTYPAPINCEHTVPQSFFGQDEPMKSDLHHLFPSYENWNSTRSNYPFDDIDDSSAEKWMYLETSVTSVPSSNIDSYSEYYSSTFEPREDHKGDCARAIFYFFTMYADNSSLTYDISDVADVNDLYQWHLNDPVDDDELARNDAIETFQGDRNPYVDYPEYVALAYGFDADASASAPISPTLDLSTTETVIDLSWSDLSTETGYYLYKSTDGSNYTLLADLSQNTNAYEDTDVAEGISYYYYGKAYNDEGTSAIGNIVSGSLGTEADDSAAVDEDSDGDDDASSGEGVGSATALFISEYIEGSSYNKAIEIANFSDESVDLSDYSLKLASNGATDWSNSLTLSGTLEAGYVYVICHGSADETIQAEADLTNNTVINFNGNDVVGLFKSTDLIDILGELGDSDNFAKDVTLVRKSTVISPNTVYTTDEWDEYATDEYSYIGYHSILSTDIADGDILNAESELSATVYPSPATTTATIQLNSDVVMQQVNVTIVNMQGSSVYISNFDINDTSYKVNVDVSGLSSGLYLIKIKTETTTITSKLLVE
jgi:hypothetical protein